LKALFKKGDVFIIAGVLVVAAIFAVIPFLKKDRGLVAVVVEDGVVRQRIDLKMVDEPYELELNGGMLLIEKDGVSYIEADCPDHSCMRMGKLKRSGDIAACVPNKTCVYLEGGNEKEVDIDAITY